MRWIIDGRCLVAGLQGGVPRVGAALCDALVRAAPADVACVTTGWRRMPLATAALERAHVHIRIPNKIWSAGAMAGVASLDGPATHRLGRMHAAFFPNIGFFGPVRTPYALLLHDVSFLIEPRWFMPKVRRWHDAIRVKRIITEAAHLFAVSETTKEDTVRLLGVRPERITVLSIAPASLSATDGSGSPFSVSDPRRKDGTVAAPAYSFPYVLAIGHGDPRKNTRLAIETVRRLTHDARGRDLRLVLLGSYPRTPEPWIIHEGRPDDARLASLYGSARALLYPSWYEGYGLPLHEAAAFGTPAIASTAGALPETAPTGTRFADPAKVHHWVEALSDVLENPPESPLVPREELRVEVTEKAAQTILTTLEEISLRSD